MRRVTRSTFALLAIALVPGSASLARGDGHTLVFEGLPKDGPEALYVLPVSDHTLTPGVYLTRDGDEPKVVQVIEDGGHRYVAARLSRDTKLEIGDPPAISAANVVLTARGDDIDVTLGNEPFTTYRGREATKPYFFPVFGPTGRPFTRAYPMEDVEGEDRDHPHQRSFWFTHGNVNGVDFWASDPLNGDKPQYGTIRERTRSIGGGGGNLVGVLRTENDWLDHEGHALLSDERVVWFHESASPRVIDFEITLKAGAAPVTFGETKEGSFGLRVASSMDVKKQQGGRITNAEGIHDTEAWGKRSPWVDYTGPVNGKTVGVAILNHPSSFRYPTAWHVRDYGLFAANPFGYKDFGINEPGEYVMKAGESIRLAYRVILHEGSTDEAKIAEAFRAYSATPKVTVRPR